MKAAVIGCNGYIGKHLALFLQDQGWEVHGYGKRPSFDLNISNYTSLDIQKRSDLDRFDTQVDHIFYFSGITGTSAAYNAYENYIDVNEKGLLHILDKVRSADHKPRIIFPSSRLVYKGVTDVPLPENAEKEFKTIYALNKWFGEQVLQQYGNYFDIPFSIFRICVPYGNLFTDSYSYGTIGFFLNRAKTGEPITLFGDGGQKRTFTHVEDICLQIYHALNKPASVNNILNISGETFSLKEVAEQIAGKYKVAVNFKDWPPMDAKLESGDTIFDGSRISQLIQKPLKNSFQSWLQTIN
jgi:UDP-glucose 4-epimerase